MKVLVLFYSTYGHIYKMAEAVAEGVRKVDGVEVDIKRVPETLPNEVLEKMGAIEAQKVFEHIPVCDRHELPEYDAIIFGVPTRYGNMAAQMKQFIDATGSLWSEGALIGKIASAFTSTATQHGGQETTIISLYTSLLHHGMVIMGLPYSFAGQSILNEVTGGSPYGASTIAGSDGSRMPSENELEGARYQGQRVAEFVAKLNR